MYARFNVFIEYVCKNVSDCWDTRTVYSSTGVCVCVCIGLNICMYPCNVSVMLYGYTGVPMYVCINWSVCSVSISVYRCIDVSMDVYIGWSKCSVSLYRRIYWRINWLKYMQCITLSAYLWTYIWLKYMQFISLSVSLYWRIYVPRVQVKEKTKCG